MMSVSVIVRDHVGQLMATMSSLVRFFINLTVAEAMAAQKVVVFGKDSRLKNIYFGREWLKIVHVIRKNDNS